MSTQFWVAASAGAGVATTLVGFLLWALGARFEKSIMKCVKAGTSELKEVLDLNKLEEAVRTVTHSVSGLNTLVMTHEEQLTTLLETNSAIASIADSSDRIALELVEINKKLYSQGMNLSHIKGRMKLPQGDD